MRRRNASVCVILTLLVVSMCLPSAAVADSQTDQGMGISVTPRFWLSTVDPLVGVTAVIEAYSVPTYGATLSYCPRGTSNYTFSLSGLWGEGTGDAVIPGYLLETSVNGIPFQMSSIASVGESNGERTDIEFLFRRTFPDKWYSLFFGLRYATWRETTTARLGYAISVGPILYQTISDEQYANLSTDLNTDYYGLEVGFSTASPIDGNGRHSLTTDFTIAAAKTKWEASIKLSEYLAPITTFLDFLGVPDTDLSGDHLSTALDVAAGYQFKNNGYGFSLRYRLMVLYEENTLEIPQMTAVSGPEVGVSFIF